MKKITLLTFFLIIISTITILVMGRTYETSYNVSDNYSIHIENSTGKAKIINEKKVNNKYIVKVKGINPGKVYLIADDGDTQNIKLLYIHKTGIITSDYIVGYTKGSETIPISISIILIYLLVILIKRYRTSIRENLYQYKNIAYLGIIIFTFNMLFINIRSIFRYNGLYGTVNNMISSFGMFSLFLLPVAFIIFVLVTISSIVLIKREGKSLRNLLAFFLGIILCTLSLLPDFVYKQLLISQTINIFDLNSIGPYLYNFIESVVYLIVVYLECILIGTVVIAIKATRKKIVYDKDYIIILGCKIRNDGSLTPLLKGRVDRALEFRLEQLKKTKKDLVFIPSGGKGNDEIIFEAEAINNYLLENGIKEKNIIVEDKSTNTYENIKYSNKLIKNKKSNIIFSTTNYHVLRAGLIASSQGLYIEGIGSKTKTYYWINAFIREFIGTLFNEKKKHLLVFTIILVFIICMIFISFLANNI